VPKVIRPLCCRRLNRNHLKLRDRESQRRMRTHFCYPVHDTLARTMRGQVNPPQLVNPRGCERPSLPGREHGRYQQCFSRSFGFAPDTVYLAEQLLGSLYHPRSPGIWDCSRNVAVVQSQLLRQRIPAGDIVRKPLEYADYGCFSRQVLSSHLLRLLMQSSSVGVLVRRASQPPLAKRGNERTVFLGSSPRALEM
jgi:hypothetical protein